jgi:hypothetical protein
MSIGQLELEQDCINSIESLNCERVKQLIRSCIGVNFFLRSKHKIWVINIKDCEIFQVVNIFNFFFQF